MVLFNYDPAKLLSFTVNDVVIEYKRTVTFLGVFLTSKLSWNYNLEYVLTKAWKSFNFLKIICKQPWGQDTPTHSSFDIISSIEVIVCSGSVFWCTNIFVDKA